MNSQFYEFSISQTINLVQSVLWDFSHLAHVQGVSENHPTRMRLKSSEGEVEDLKVPGDAHPKEEPDVDQHLVPLLVPASAAAARTSKI